jgi:xylan 1,4-beta-xylosidase
MAQEVKSWYFDIWNERKLSGLWAGTQEKYFKLYEYSVKAIKSVNQEYKVGGPATAGAASVCEMINFCNKNAVPLEFISTHIWGKTRLFR